MSKVNTDVSLDPDFGSLVPTVEIAYWATVLFDDKERPPFRFVLMMPMITDTENENAYIEEAVFQLIGDDATVKLKPIEHEDFVKLSKSTFIASFLPENPEEFVWLRPPLYLQS